MAQSLIEAFGIDRGVVALVGAGGKTTLAFAIGEEVRRSGGKAIVTTTTRLGAEQTNGLEVVPPDAERIAAALDAAGICLVIEGTDDHKALGVPPEWVDDVWASGLADVVTVEADGARRQKVKAPATYEPVIPRSATLVVAVMAAAAVGRVIADVAHRPEIVASLLGVETSAILTPERAAVLLASRRGGRKSVPEHARFVVAITGASGGDEVAARSVAEWLAPVESVLIPADPELLERRPPLV